MWTRITLSLSDGKFPDLASMVKTTCELVCLFFQSIELEWEAFSKS